MRTLNVCHTLLKALEIQVGCISLKQRPLNGISMSLFQLFRLLSHVTQLFPQTTHPHPTHCKLLFISHAQQLGHLLYCQVFCYSISCLGDDQDLFLNKGKFFPKKFLFPANEILFFIPTTG